MTERDLSPGRNLFGWGPMRSVPPRTLIVAPTRVATCDAAVAERESHDATSLLDAFVQL